jgi:hypothetical protein
MVLESEEIIIFYRVISRIWIEFFSTFEERIDRTLLECMVVFRHKVAVPVVPALMASRG